MLPCWTLSQAWKPKGTESELNGMPLPGLPAPSECLNYDHTANPQVMEIKTTLRKTNLSMVKRHSSEGRGKESPKYGLKNLTGHTPLPEQ